jgi:eukaryotic-like serine/threonine-protein kinase
MKRCPQCRRDYYDDTLFYCLDDGAALLDGPGTSGGPETAVLPTARASNEAATKTLTSDRQAATVRSPSRRNQLIAASIGFFIVAALAAGAYFYFGRGPSRQIESIAVMPFLNAAGNPDIEYLSDGITESLINSLSQVPSLSVKARSSVFTYKGKEVTAQQVGKDLSVQAVLNGRVTQRGDQVLLNVELVDAATGNQIWGDQYMRRIADLVQLQSEIARDVSGKLKAKLSGADQDRVVKNYTGNSDAYKLYLRGRYHWNKRTRDDVRKSIEFFQQAADRDPTYALAYAALAESYILAPNYALTTSQDAYPKARAAALKSIEIDPTLAESHNALASVMSGYDWKFNDAETEWRKALSLNPNYATGHQWYGEHLLFMGRYEEGLAEMRLAEQLDPLSLIINALLGTALRLNGKPGEAEEQFRKTLEMDPKFPRAHLFLAELYQFTGRYEEAVDEFAKVFELGGGPSERIQKFTTTVKAAYKANGPKGYSRAMAELFESDKSLSPPATVLAGYWLAAGETDKAFAVLEEAFRNHEDGIIFLRDPRLDAMKSDPRYHDLLRRVGFPDP